jgi:transposase
VAVPAPSSTTRWRCAQCGNLTRFDVVRSSRVREYVHLNLAGEPRVEETEVLDDRVEQVRCRWCASTESIELVPRFDSSTGPVAGGT